MQGYFSFQGTITSKTGIFEENRIQEISKQNKWYNYEEKQDVLNLSGGSTYLFQRNQFSSKLFSVHESRNVWQIYKKMHAPGI